MALTPRPAARRKYRLRCRAKHESRGPQGRHPLPRQGEGETTHNLCAALLSLAKGKGPGVGEYLPPLVDGEGATVAGGHDAPVAVGLTADDRDVDLVLQEHRDHLVVWDGQPGRERLLAVRRPGVDVVLD